MTPTEQLQLSEVNREVNLVPYDALPGPGEEEDWWTNVLVPGNSFVCRDFVLMKADRLKALGWPASALTVVLCWTEPVGVERTREYHAVLAVETGDAQPMILDSRFDRIYRMDEPLADYEWDRRQVAGTTGFSAA